MKTAELTGPLLDYWVARAEGWEHVNAILLRKVDKVGLAEMETRITTSREGDYGGGRPPIFFSPSTSWATGGPIIEREPIEISPNFDIEGRSWQAGFLHAGYAGIYFDGPTPLIAAMRAYVASKFGDDVPEVPDA